MFLNILNLNKHNLLKEMINLFISFFSIIKIYNKKGNWKKYGKWKIEVDLSFATLVTEDENKESWTSSKEIKIFNCHERTIEIDEDEEKLVKDILSSNLGQLYQKYGFKRKEIIISHNVKIKLL